VRKFKGRSDCKFLTSLPQDQGLAQSLYDDIPHVHFLIILRHCFSTARENACTRRYGIARIVLERRKKDLFKSGRFRVRPYTIFLCVLSVYGTSARNLISVLATEPKRMSMISAAEETTSAPCYSSPKSGVLNLDTRPDLCYPSYRRRFLEYGSGLGTGGKV
jgi:hypothetical protein